ncbi:MAG TPA: hypothetical protein VGH11_13510 [Jatrophihabitans sp.]|jgi:hypothetical protein
MLGLVVGGHDITRSESVLTGPFAPLRVVSYDCPSCEWTTEWMSTRHEELAQALVRQHLSEVPRCSTAP